MLMRLNVLGERCNSLRREELPLKDKGSGKGLDTGTEKWRLLGVETPDDASMNMAIEEAIFIAEAEGEVPPTVRFWRSKGAVVIGYSQTVEAEVNLELCERSGLQVVRRFSGGGATYHDLGNLNYSIAMEANHPLVKGLEIADSYVVFASGVIQGLRELGIHAVFAPPSNVLVEGRKVSGNAQSRRKGAVLHHGTLLVDADLDLLDEVLGRHRPRRKSEGVVSKKVPVTNLADELGRDLNMNEVKAALGRGFEAAFCMELVPSTFTTTEEMTARRLHAEKYSRKEWNFWR